MAYGLSAWALPMLQRDHVVAGRLTGSVNGSVFSIPLQLQKGGVVRVDGTAAVRRTLDCVVLADIRSPSVSPFGAEVRVEYGILQGVREEWVPVGTFVVYKSEEVGEAGSGLVRLTCRDRYTRIQRARLEDPTPTAGSVVNAIRVLVEGADSRIPTLVVAPSVVDSTHPWSVWEKDRDKAVESLARSIGCQVYFTPLGVPMLAPIPEVPDASSPGTWELFRGNGGAKITSAMAVTQEGTYNAVKATGESLDGSTPPVSAKARDTVVTSPTVWGGPFGKVTYFFTSRLMTTTAQCQAAADGLLAKVVGRAWSVSAEGLPRPDLETGDSLQIEVAPERWQTHRLDGFTIPLGVGSVKYLTRSTAAEVDASS